MIKNNNKEFRSFQKIEPFIYSFLQRTIYKAKDVKFALEYQKKLIEGKCFWYLEETKESIDLPMSKLYSEYRLGNNIDKYFFNEEYIEFWESVVCTTSEFEETVEKELGKEFGEDKLSPLRKIFFTILISPLVFIKKDEFPYKDIYERTFAFIFILEASRIISENLEFKIYLHKSYPLLFPLIQQTFQFTEQIQRKSIEDGYKPNNIEIYIYPDHKESISKVIKPYFPDCYEKVLIHLFEKNYVDNLFVFNGSANKLTDFFRKLYDAQYMTKCSKKDLIDWTIRHFRFISKNKEQDFVYERTKKMYTSNDPKIFTTSPLINISTKGEIIIL